MASYLSNNPIKSSIMNLNVEQITITYWSLLFGDETMAYTSPRKMNSNLKWVHPLFHKEYNITATLTNNPIMIGRKKVHPCVHIKIKKNAKSYTVSMNEKTIRDFTIMDHKNILYEAVNWLEQNISSEQENEKNMFAQ